MDLKNILRKGIVLLSCSVFFIGCQQKTQRTPQQRIKPKIESPYSTSIANDRNVIKVPYKEQFGVKIIPVRINGVTLDMIYDTGCSGIHLSLAELQILYKNGQFSDDDIIGVSCSQIADGSIVQNQVVTLRSIEIGGEQGITLYNVDASVSLNQNAPVLLGNGVLDAMASVEVDNINKTINFSRY